MGVSVLLGVLLALSLGGCAKSQPPELTVQEIPVVSGFELDVSRTVSDGSGYADLLQSIDEVIALARMKPDAVYHTEFDGSRTMRQVLADAAGRLSRYRPEMAKQLELAIQTLPPAK